MEAEGLPLVESLGLRRDEPSRIAPPAPCVTFSGSRHGIDIHLVCNGKCAVHGVDNVGTVPAALTTYLALQALRPDLVVSVGTAGGFAARGAKIGDVFVATGFANHDRRIPLPGFDKYGVWACGAHPVPNLQKALKLKEGVVSSGNSLDYCQQDWDQMVASSAAIKEMEAAGIAWAAALHGTPLLALKAVTDIVDGDRPAQDEFLENLAAAARALQETVPPALEFVAGKTLAEL
ncbi:hypothetical protein WJX81_003627 [Elliptochloris bilobata]|uniref:Nucleoside phosphorylase domain-containing protein n=1 Tax=Elliptochloris bilobata TaxID=381761 RepID=A0AAW1RZV1_9CHLO